MTFVWIFLLKIFTSLCSRTVLRKRHLRDQTLEVLTTTLSGPTALVFGGNSVVDVARNLVDWAKKVKQLDLKAAILDGELVRWSRRSETTQRLPNQKMKRKVQSSSWYFHPLEISSKQQQVQVATCLELLKKSELVWKKGTQSIGL